MPLVNVCKRLVPGAIPTNNLPEGYLINGHRFLLEHPDMNLFDMN